MIFLFTVLTAIFFLLRIGQNEYMIQFLLDGSDAPWIFTADYIGDLLRKCQRFLIYNLLIFNDIDGDVVINKAQNIQVNLFQRTFDFDDVLFPILLLLAFLMMATQQSSLSRRRYL